MKRTNNLTLLVMSPPFCAYSKTKIYGLVKSVLSIGTMNYWLNIKPSDFQSLRVFGAEISFVFFGGFIFFYPGLRQEVAGGIGQLDCASPHAMIILSICTPGKRVNIVDSIGFNRFHQQNMIAVKFCAAF